MAQGNLADALKSFRDGLAVRERLTKVEPTNAGWQRDLWMSYNKVGDALVHQDNLAEALKSFRDGLAIGERLANADPTNTNFGKVTTAVASAGAMRFFQFGTKFSF